MKNLYSGFKVGQQLIHRWTNSGNQYEAIVEVVKVNTKSIRVKLIDSIPEGYKPNQEWAVSILSQTQNNGLFELNKDEVNNLRHSDYSKYLKHKVEEI